MATKIYLRRKASQKTKNHHQKKKKNFPITDKLPYRALAYIQLGSMKGSRINIKILH